MVEYIDMKEDGKMFDSLVDTTKKRLYIVLLLSTLGMIGSLVFDLFFGVKVFFAGGFSDLINVLGSCPNSYFGYFFYSLVTSSMLYTKNIFLLLFEVLKGLVISFNFIDWFNLIALVSLIFSHKHKMSKRIMYVLMAFFVGRMILALGAVGFLYPAMVINSAGLLVNRIHLIGFVYSILLLVVLFFLGGYFYSILKLLYLPLFSEEAD